MAAVAVAVLAVLAEICQQGPLEALAVLVHLLQLQVQQSQEHGAVLAAASVTWAQPHRKAKVMEPAQAAEQTQAVAATGRQRMDLVAALV
jgi:hypothetical protein